MSLTIENLPATNMLQHSDISFEKDDSSRFLPWLIAFMVFLAALSIAGIFVVNDITRKLGTGANNTITVQIPASESAVTDELRKVEALRLLRILEGVERAELVKAEKVKELLRPWLGEVAGSEQLPLPYVIDVEINRTTGVSAGILKAKLSPGIPGVLVDDHRKWLNNLIKALRSTEFIALSIVLLIGLATLGTVIFTTRTSMGLQRETIAILHFIGAHDSYIAQQFAVRAAWLGIKGGMAGLIVAVPLLFGFRLAIGSLSTGLLPDLTLPVAGWISLGLIIPAVATIAMLTAYSTVLKSLSNLL